MRALLTRRMIDDCFAPAHKARIQQPFGFQNFQKFKNVVSIVRHQLGLFAGDAQHGVVFVLESQRATGGCTDDGVAVAHPHCQFTDICQRIRPRRFEIAVGLHRQAAAILLGNAHLDLIPFQHFDGRLPHARLVVIGGAAVKIDNLSRADHAVCRLRLSEPGPKRLPRKCRELGARIYAQRALDQLPQRRNPQGDVRQRREG